MANKKTKVLRKNDIKQSPGELNAKQGLICNERNVGRGVGAPVQNPAAGTATAPMRKVKSK